MYNGNSEWIRLRPNPLRITSISAEPKKSNSESVTNGYTRPLVKIGQ